MAWLTRPVDGIGDVGVVIVPPLGYEYWSSHRTLRTLAERLAQNGCLALRFDFDGTGDSAGDQWDPARLEAWQSNIGQAAGRPARVGRHQAGRHRAAHRRHAGPDAGRGGRRRCRRRLGAGRTGKPLRPRAAVARSCRARNAGAPRAGRRRAGGLRLLGGDAGRAWGHRRWEHCRIAPPRGCWSSTEATSRPAPPILDRLRALGVEPDHIVREGAELFLDQPTEYATVPDGIVDEITGVGRFERGLRSGGGRAGAPDHRDDRLAGRDCRGGGRGTRQAWASSASSPGRRPASPGAPWSG